MLQQRAHWLPRVLANEGPALEARVALSLRVLVTEELEVALATLPAAQRRCGEQLAAQAARTLVTAAAGDPAALDAGGRAWLEAQSHCLATPDGLAGWQ